MLLICVHLQLDSSMNREELFPKPKKVINDNNRYICCDAHCKEMIITDLLVNHINITFSSLRLIIWI